MNRYFSKSLVTALLACASIAYAQDCCQMEYCFSKPYCWTGYYVGVHGGYDWGQHTARPVGLLYNADPNERFPSTPSGAFGGVQLGGNWQTSSHFVPGLEMDLGYLSFKSNKLSSSPGITDTFSQSQGGFYGTITTRFGFTNFIDASTRLLVYAKGGYAFFVPKLGVVDNDPAGLTINASEWKYLNGWTAGGGSEYALSDSWTIKAEYLYMDFGHHNVSGVASDGLTYTWSHGVRVQTVKLGVNYRF